ncbi:Short chain dehydrogenase-like protein 37 [Elsinoe fawcettii]|nr:Short chain dehydrogenase-like protein 37 [Elsinoe fawcettii]
MVVFDPKTDIPSLKGRTVLITGGTAGLGRATIFLLATASPSYIIFTGRSQSSADAVLSSFRPQFPFTTITFLPIDLSSLSSVRAGISTLSLPRLDILILNAGIMATPPSLSTDGYDTNHLGHALMVQLLLPLLLGSAEGGRDVRIVSFSSDLASFAPKGGIGFPSLRTTQEGGAMGAWRRYGQSKLANILYVRELARRYPQILAVAIHPGVAFTSLQRDQPWMQGRLVSAVLKRVMSSVDEVMLNGVWAATGPRGDGVGEKGRKELGRVESGGYYLPVGVRDGRKRWNGTDDKLAAKLWEWTEKELQGWVIGEKK